MHVGTCTCNSATSSREARDSGVTRVSDVSLECVLAWCVAWGRYQTKFIDVFKRAVNLVPNRGGYLFSSCLENATQWGSSRLGYWLHTFNMICVPKYFVIIIHKLKKWSISCWHWSLKHGSINMPWYPNAASCIPRWRTPGLVRTSERHMGTGIGGGERERSRKGKKKKTKGNESIRKKKKKVEKERFVSPCLTTAGTGMVACFYFLLMA